MPEIKELIDNLNTAFEEHKRKNDQRLKEIEEKGHADPLLEETTEKLTAELQNLSELKERLEGVETKLSRPGLPGPGDEADPVAAEKKAAVLNYMRKGEGLLSADEIKLLSSDSDTDGGYMLESDVSNQAIMKHYETSPMREIANVENISSSSLEIPEDTNEADAGWTGEREARPETNTPTIGVLMIPVHELYAMPKCTQNFLDDAKVDIETWLGNKVGEKITRTENAAFITGNGVKKPRGILNHPAGTGAHQIQQVNSGSAGALTGDGLRSLFYKLKSPYIANAKWLMSRSAIEGVSKLKDGNGNYLWQPGFQEGEPQNLLGHSIKRMDDMPAVAANSLSIAFGDFNQGYTIVDRMGLRVLRDPFTAKPFVLFYTTKRTGGDVTNFEAFVIQKTAA
jgi:HK97 family phage major capsid protein